MKRLLIGVAVVLVLLVGTALVAQRVADGPMGPLSGGQLRKGELVTDPNVDWVAVDPKEIELQLVEPMGSRTTGSLVYEGQLYVPCDLGFIWRRIPSAGFRAIASILWAVKHWNEDAVRDGRVVIRTGGKRYERQAVRVTDPELLAKLRSLMEEKAAKYMHVTLRDDVPADPEAIWFFRLDPRPAGNS